MTDELTMTDGQRLLRRILDNPEDDAPRLILSDWLEDNGEEERARFIRSQVFLSRNDNPPPCSKPEDCYYANRCQHNCGVVDRDRVCEPHWKIVRDLFDKHKCEWFGESWAILYLDSEREDADGQFEGSNKAFASRGFISEIRLTCEQFCGGPCRSCNGSGHPTENGYLMLTLCRSCAGTGRIEGVARELFSQHPITRVVLVDRKAWAFGGSASDYAWWPEGGPHARNCATIDREIYNRLFRFRAEFGGKVYHTEAAAIDALSAACVAYGRNLVGLPSLADNSNLQ